MALSLGLADVRAADLPLPRLPEERHIDLDPDRGDRDGEADRRNVDVGRDRGGVGVEGAPVARLAERWEELARAEAGRPVAAQLGVERPALEGNRLAVGTDLGADNPAAFGPVDIPEDTGPEDFALGGIALGDIVEPDTPADIPEAQALGRTAPAVVDTPADTLADTAPAETALAADDAADWPWCSPGCADARARCVGG